MQGDPVPEMRRTPDIVEIAIFTLPKLFKYPKMRKQVAKWKKIEYCMYVKDGVLFLSGVTER